MSDTRIRKSDPVVVAVSKPDETRWGHHQFPALSRLPDGRILLMYADADDASETHGEAAPAFVSDDGRQWVQYLDAPRPIRPHYSISAVADGEYLACPASKYFDVRGSSKTDDGKGPSELEREIASLLPAPIAVSEVYGKLFTYRCADLDVDIQGDFENLNAQRYSRVNDSWAGDVIGYDLNDRLAWRRAGSSLLPRPFFERALTRYRDELLYPDYRVRFALPDGRISPKGCTWLMASKDNGHSFSRRGLVAVDPSGHDLQGEPTLEVTSCGDLVCVVRRTDHVQKPMAITWSRNCGETWTPSLDLFTFGVFPCLLRLACGTLLLSYGRPGVHVAASHAGDGKVWDENRTIIAGDPRNVNLHSCGYTSLISLSDDRALIAYSDFDHRESGGTGHKAICVREITIV